MNPGDVRNLTWQEVQNLVTGARERVFAALREGGPMTTTRIAAATGIHLLTVRPRVSELVDLGLVRCTGRSETSKEGVYEALPEHEARAAHDARHAATQPRSTQVLMPFVTDEEKEANR